ncbi:surface antigen BspA-like [Trichomonas vaginalis G3]|uniref:Surface antigen BspA-like n=1 Tax=Trichomonas vaginalis (strain ATCC PRA-98 / G3) TaxID=412133 RepID=A2DXU0_TRIV3|nr:surface antigen BspA-like [Trichomonas vaginalis G3]|eukprot:XP_001327023.1 surface antigen BspA-like [Trichomonas vaginalis G3]
MMMLFLFVVYKDIDDSCYSDGGKNLTKVGDPWPDLRISAKCEIIKRNCFSSLSSLNSFTFEENPNLIIIEHYGFSYCSNLASIDLSTCTKLTIICEYAFQQCKKLSNILFPKGLLEIQSDAFYQTSLGPNITIPASVKIIGDSAFNLCKLKTVIFEEDSNLSTLEAYAFGGITSIQIPENVIKVSAEALNYVMLSNLSIHPKNNFLMIDNEILYSADKSSIFKIFNKSFEQFDIPNSVTTIGEYSFEMSNLVTITIPENVKRIEKLAFFCCRNLINMTIQGPLDYFGDQAVDFCDDLKLIIFPNSPMNVTGFHLFTEYSPKLRLSFTNKTLFSSSAIIRNANISVAYMHKENLIIDRNSLIMDSEQTKIYEFWGYSINEVLQITIPKTVTKIRESAFENSVYCEIKFEDGSQLSVIERYAFRNSNILFNFHCKSTNLKIIGLCSFQNCQHLTYVSFVSPILEIMNNAFENCCRLYSVSGLYNISDYCFSGCNRLCNVVIREGSEIIGVRAFDHCNSLESINIPSSVKIISDYAFINCDKLKSITFTEANQLSNISINSISSCESLSYISNFSSDYYECNFSTIYRVSKGAFSTALYMRLLKEIYADYKYIIKNMNICI